MQLIRQGYVNANCYGRGVGGPHGDATTIDNCRAQPDGPFDLFAYTPIRSGGYRSAGGHCATRANSYLVTRSIRIT